MADRLRQLGYTSVRQLRNQNPERMYQRLCRLQDRPVDRCVLYVFRCAVYFVSHDRHDPGRLKWWNWRDRRAPDPKRQ